MRDFMVIKPPKVIPWDAMRIADDDILVYDGNAGEAVCNAPGYVIRVSSEWFKRKMTEKQPGKPL